MRVKDKDREKMGLAGQTALVTGGAVRLGREIALALAAEGVRVALHYNGSSAEAVATISEIRDKGGDADLFQADLSSLGALSRMLAQVEGRFGGIDILVNSAAVFLPGDLIDTTEELWDKHFAVNLKAPFFLSQGFAGLKREGGGGQIINIVDWRAVRPGPHYLAYTIAKAGLLTMTRSLALGLAPAIRVNAIAPGAILPPPGKDDAYLQRLAQHLPLQRQGNPGEVVQALFYLLTAEFVTGQILFVDGGEHL